MLTYWDEILAYIGMSRTAVTTYDHTFSAATLTPLDQTSRIPPAGFGACRISTAIDPDKHGSAFAIAGFLEDSLGNNNVQE